MQADIERVRAEARQIVENEFFGALAMAAGQSLKYMCPSQEVGPQRA